MKKILMIGYTLAVLVLGIVVGSICGGADSLSAQCNSFTTECLYVKTAGQAVEVYLRGFCINKGKQLTVTDLGTGYRIDVK